MHMPTDVARAANTHRLTWAPQQAHRHAADQRERLASSIPVGACWQCCQGRTDASSTYWPQLPGSHPRALVPAGRRQRRQSLHCCRLRLWQRCLG